MYCVAPEGAEIESVGGNCREVCWGQYKDSSNHQTYLYWAVSGADKQLAGIIIGAVFIQQTDYWLWGIQDTGRMCKIFIDTGFRTVPAT